jgi:aminopeptidase-like protein
MNDQRLIKLIEALFPICRSITGSGVRRSLEILQEIIPLKIVEVPTGTKILDWEVPREWTVNEAYIENPSGERIVDFSVNNLHLLGYSAAVRDKMSLEDLRPHLFSIPTQPDLIPYRTSYYDDNWGFCLPHRQLESLKDGEYQVVIDSNFKDGSLSYGEFYLPGRSTEEVLISTHVCHPSLCNDNLSGIAVSTFLAESLRDADRKYSYRFLYVPATIGSIAWLAGNEDIVGNIRHGIVASNLADSGGFTYKKSRFGRAGIDRAVEHVLETSGVSYEVRDFVPYGYDERQYCSPGFDLPVGSLSRTPYGEYPEYHTSADNLSFVSHDNLQQSLDIYRKIIDTLEAGRYFKNLLPKGEPQLGRRGLYKKVGGETDQKESQMAMLWLLNFSDGEHSVFDIAVMSGIAVDVIDATAALLESNGLLVEIIASA